MKQAAIFKGAERHGYRDGWRGRMEGCLWARRLSRVLQFFRDTDNGPSLFRLTEEINNKINEFGFFANILTFETSAEYVYIKYVSRDSIEKCFES